jgi:hypothetical protein
MAVAMFIRSPQLGRAEYDRLVAGLELDARPPFGQLLHFGVERDGRVDVVEIWQTAAAALAYVENRLTPGLESVKAKEPEVELVALHNLFAPDLDAIGLIGGISLPAYVVGAALP